jgi:sugar phosphate isomerase/epimerase
MTFTRRDLGRIALTALPAANGLLSAAAAKPNSKFAGVQIGINAPYSYRGLPGTAEDVLKYTTGLGLSAVELRTQPVEAYLGAPKIPGVNTGRFRGKMTPEQEAAFNDLNKWRLGLSMDKVKAFRKMYEDAGVAIQVVKVDAIDTMSDDVANYFFTLVKALGGKALSCEIPVSRTKWLGEIAAKHKLMVGYHGHANMHDPEAFASPESWEKAMSFSKYNGINLDIGHFIAGNNVSPVEFLKKHHDRVTHIHLKDRKKNDGPNFVWGQGETPIVEVLQLMRKEKYPFQATIEFEYKPPEGSDVLQEIGKCVEYCKKALV